jgi:[protein-PII] uridylyltransferase
MHTIHFANPLDIKTEKGQLREVRESIKHAFESGEAVEHLIRRYSQQIDQLLCHYWHHFLGDSALTLAAVGGYGRGELHPYSDIDLLILHEAPVSADEQAALQQFVTFLWDIGLEVGQSLRDIQECIIQAEGDITVATNLMESRLLSGSTTLHEQMRAATGPDKIWPGDRFFAAKLHEQRKRHARFNDTAYNLEPNIKEGPGGLRDIQNIGWVAKRHFGAARLADLVTHHFLTADEYQRLYAGEQFLWRVRFGLHSICGRREDRLLFDHQRTLAKQFGYHDSSSRMAVEYFMRDYYRTITELERLNEQLLQLYEQEILRKGLHDTIKVLNRRFNCRNNLIEASSEQVFEHYPFALLEIFLLMAQHPEIVGVSAGTIRLIRSNIQRIDEQFRADIKCRALFIELLRQTEGVTLVLRRMNRYGVLAAYLPEFGAIVGQMQHDLFHVYTVDEHTLRVLRNLRRLTVPKFAHEFPLCSRIMAAIPKPELIYIAALYHDIAKGRGGDHSQLGGEDAELFCQRHLLSRYDTHLVRWLVEHHLIMSTTAQRKDLNDPEVIHNFAELTADQTLLDYLFLLTVADIRATSPTLWNSWKESLLTELYLKTTKALRRGLNNKIKLDELSQLTRQEASKWLQGQGEELQRIEAIWNNCGSEYFWRYNAKDVSWHTMEILHNISERSSLVSIRQNSERGGTEVFIHTPVMDTLFAQVTATLAQMGLSIVDAKIMQAENGQTLDTYVVLDQDGEPVCDPHQISRLKSRLEEMLSGHYQAPGQISGNRPRQLRLFAIPTLIYFAPEGDSGHTVIEVISTDQPGLLSQIARALSELPLILHNARITTLGERAEDLFFVSSANDQAIDEEATRAAIYQAIGEEIN